jgi:outer membrane protein assembly factor BamB
MTKYSIFFSFLIYSLIAQSADWPQGQGPNYNWQISADTVLTDFSVALNKNIIWKTALPEGGQSSVTIAGNKLFLTCQEQWPETKKEKPKGTGIVGYCLDRANGKILWQVKLKGTKLMNYAGLFSDSTSPSPISDGKHVWFFNASGSMGCYDMDGKQIWIREFLARTKHNARKCTPFILGDHIYYVEVKNKQHAAKFVNGRKLLKGVDINEILTYIHIIDKHSGKVVKLLGDATSIHSTPELGQLKDKSYAILHGRGGGHGPPEKPYGISLSSLKEGQIGKTIWRSEESLFPYYNAQFNQDYVPWMSKTHLLIFDTDSGKVISRKGLYDQAVIRVYDLATKSYKDGDQSSLKSVISKRAPITYQTNMLVGDYLYFRTFAGNCIGRINCKTGKSEYLQVPLQLVREPDKADIVKYSDFIKNDTKNSRGVDIGIVDARSKGNGWGHCSASSPVLIGKYLFFSTMLGTVYVIDTTLPLNEKALTVNDLGPAGKTWSQNSLSFADGMIYTRSMKEVICIGNK